MGYIWGLLAVSGAVASALVVVSLPHLGGPGRTELFARFAIAAGIAAVGSTLLYAFFELEGGILALVLGDAFMVLGPGSMLLAVSALTGRSDRLRVAVIALSAIVLAVAVTTASIDKPVSLVVKAAALSVLCLWVAGQTRRDGLAGQPGMATLLAVNVVYGLFSAARIVVGAVLGWESELYRAAFSIYPTTAVGAAAVLFTGVAVFRVLRFHGLGARDVEPTAAVHEIQGVVVALGEVPAVRAAFGTATVVALLSGLDEACAAVAAALAGPERSGSVTTETVTALVRAELERRGWSASEIGLVTVASASVARTPESGGRPRD
jgi:hypothetical protein